MFKRFAAFAAVAALVLAVGVSAAPPPSVTITSGPPAQTTSTDAVITFVTSGDPGNYALRCTLDTTVSPTCTSPQNFTNLSVGLHKFSVAWCKDSICKRGDTHNWEVTGSPPPPVTPTADFTWAPTNPVPNEAVSFTCLTDTGTVCRWDKNLDQVPDAELPPSQPWVTTYVGTGTKTPCLQTGNSSGNSAWVCHNVVVVDSPPPPPTSYTYRFATFDPATDKITGTLNRFTPSYSWWVPGTPEGTLWPSGGGIFPETHPTYGPGFRMVVTNEMLYGNATAGPKDSNIIRAAVEPKNQSFFPPGNPLEVPVSGTTHEWKATYSFGGGPWANGNYESMWEMFATHNNINSVYHHLFHRVSGGVHNYYLAWQHAPPTESPPQTYIWTQIQGPTWNAGDFHTIRWQIRWSDPGVANGFIKAWTSVNGGPEVQWANVLNIPTKLSSFQSAYAAGHFGIRAPLGLPPLEMKVYNLGVTIS